MGGLLGSGACAPLIALSALSLVACRGSGEDLLSPPPAGVPWLARKLAFTSEILGGTCLTQGSDFILTGPVGTLEQDGRRVTLSFSPEDPDSTARPLTVRGCVVGDATSGFQLRLSGLNRSGVSQGAAPCFVRLALPEALGAAVDVDESQARASGAAASAHGTDEGAWLAHGCKGDEVDYFELCVCENGTLRGETEAQLAWFGAACHAGPPCTLSLRFRGVKTEDHPDLPPGALLGVPCED